MKKVRSVLLLAFAGLVGFSARRFGASSGSVEAREDGYRASSYHVKRYPFLAEDFWRGSSASQIVRAKRSLDELMLAHEELRINYINLQMKLQRCEHSNDISDQIKKRGVAR